MGGNGSGNKRKDVDMEAVLDLMLRGEKIPAIAADFGISPPTLRKRVAEIQKEQGVLLEYRALQSLQLTGLQAKVLEAMTDEKIEQASLKDLAAVYKILKEKELTIEGKPSEIKGLVAHLIYLEKQEAALKSANPEGATLIEHDPDLFAECGDEPETDEEQKSLSDLDDQQF